MPRQAAGRLAMVIESREDRGALAGCRGLARDGWIVGSVGRTATSYCAASRSTRFRDSAPSPADGFESFLSALERAVARRGYNIIFPGWGDAETMAISECRERMGAIVPLPAHQDLMRGLDKVELSELAVRAGLDAPTTREVDEAALKELRPPFVMKPRTHAQAIGDRSASQLGAKVLYSTEEARIEAGRMRHAGVVPIIQEAVVGGLMAMTLLTDRDCKPIARVQQEAIRIWPRDGGVSALARTRQVDEDLAGRALNLLRELNWTGLAELQFLVHPERGPLLIDLNPRFYGSMSLAIKAGANLPALWASTAVGERVDSVRDGKPGVYFRWFEGNSRSVWSQPNLSRPAKFFQLATEAFHPACHPIWELRDPGPGLLAAGHIIGRIPRRVLRKPRPHR